MKARGKSRRGRPAPFPAFILLAAQEYSFDGPLDSDRFVEHRAGFAVKDGVLRAEVEPAPIDVPGTDQPKLPGRAWSPSPWKAE